MTRPDVPIACSLELGELADRRAEWRRLAELALRERREIPGGVRLVYAALEGVEATLRELARLEARCCAFADWRVAREGDAVVLEVTAPGAGAEAVRSLVAQA